MAEAGGHDQLGEIVLKRFTNHYAILTPARPSATLSPRLRN